MLLDMDVTSHGMLATRSPLICCCGLRCAILYCGEHRSCSRAVRIVVWASPAAWNGKVVCFRLQRCGERAVAVYVKVRVQTFRKRLHGDFTYIGKVLDIGMWASLFVVRRRSASIKDSVLGAFLHTRTAGDSVYSSSATWLAVYVFGLDTQCTQARTP